MKLFWLFFILLSIIDAKENIQSLQYGGVKVVYQNKEITIARERDSQCLDIPVAPESLYGGDFANSAVPKACKKTFLTSAGIVQPISLDPKIMTVGELEVLDHIKKSQIEPLKYILIDSRKHEWFEQMSIPTAVNLPYTEIEYDKDFEEDFEKMLKMLTISKTKNGLDFSKAKVAILFCNGSWCVQSPRAIKKLIALGYPKEKLMWYRGGLQDWLAFGFTVLKNP